METQLRQLKRQARQASRYKNISGQIRVLALHLRWQQVFDMVEETETQLIGARKAASERCRSGSAATAQTEAQAALRLREAEASAAGGLRRLTLEQESLDAEAERATQMVARLQQQIETITLDAARVNQAMADAEAQLRLAEEAEMKAAISDDETRRKSKLLIVAAKRR